MMDCKKALNETNGDKEKAVEFLREKGLAAIAKKANRIAAEGLVATILSDDHKTGAIVEAVSYTHLQIGLEGNCRAKADKCAVQAGHGDESIEKLGVAVRCFSAERNLLNKVGVFGHLPDCRFHSFRMGEGNSLKGFLTCLLYTSRCV